MQLTAMRAHAGVFDCKPLAFIWRKFPEVYSHSNTIMLDDLNRNYIMNKQNGLVIRPFRKAHQNRATDRELVRLKYYLQCIGKLSDLSHLKHRKWERYLHEHLQAADKHLMQADLASP